MSPKHAKRRDLCEPELVKLARTLGAWMIKLDEPCDWLMWYRGNWQPVEVKDPGCEGHADEFTPAQRAFRAEAFRRCAKLIVWRTREDVFNVLGARQTA
jgi:hypothetical protein